MIERLNSDFLAERTFLVGEGLTGADIIIFCFTLGYVSKQMDEVQRLAHANLFRWVYQLQYLPEMLQIIREASLFVPFP